MEPLLNQPWYFFLYFNLNLTDSALLSITSVIFYIFAKKVQRLYHLLSFRVTGNIFLNLFWIITILDVSSNSWHLWSTIDFQSYRLFGKYEMYFKFKSELRRVKF